MTRDMFVARLEEAGVPGDRARASLAVVVGAGIDPAEAFATVQALELAGPPAGRRTYRED